VLASKERWDDRFLVTGHHLHRTLCIQHLQGHGPKHLDPPLQSTPTELKRVSFYANHMENPDTKCGDTEIPFRWDFRAELHKYRLPGADEMCPWADSY